MYDVHVVYLQPIRSRCLSHPAPLAVSAYEKTYVSEGNKCVEPAPHALACLLDCSTTREKDRTMLVARITPQSVTVYRSGVAPESAAANLEKARAVIAAEGYRGEMNDRTAARVKRILRAWFIEAKCKAGNIGLSDAAVATKFTFVTLTLPAPQVHTDNELKRQALRPFLQEIGRRFGARNYVWKAEPQKNGNIHFHILLDKFIPWPELRKLWNHYLQPLGYIDRYRERQQQKYKDGMVYEVRASCKSTPAQQLAAYAEGVRTNWSNPNSTDIHSLRSVKHIIAYISAYIVKKANRRKIEGRIWDCTDNLPVFLSLKHL